MSHYLDRAKTLRAIVTPHYNCGQAVILPFAETLGIPEDLVMRFAANYGRGMKDGALCGAIAGGATVLALYGLDDPASTERYYLRLHMAHPEAIDCTPLLSLNALRGGEKKPFCDALVYEVVTLVEELLRDAGKLNTP